MAREDSPSDTSEIQATDPTGDPRLPTDVWPDIVSHLSYESIENVMFVCRYFRTLAQPSFFRTLAVKPFSIDSYSTPLPRNEDDSSWIWQKLQFYSSPTIARHVEFCRISPHSGLDLVLGSDDRAIIDAIFELLPQLTNLTEIDLNLVQLTEDNKTQMSRIPRLNTVLMTNCRTAATPIHLGVRTVLLSKRHYFSPVEDIRLLSWLLQPAAVECLCIGGGSVTMAFFNIVHRLPPLRCLHTLCINYLFTPLASLLPCLSQLPALREITFHTRDFSNPDPSLLSPLTIPLLERYEGPLHLARYFSQGRPVRHLKLCDMSTGDDLLRHLRTLNSSAEIESLEFHVGDVNKLLLHGLFDERVGFPKIKALEITSDFMDQKMLTHVLPTIQLPLGIEYLSIIQSCRPPVRAVPRDEFVVKKAYLKRYPALRYVAFSVNGYLYQVDPSTGAPVKKSKTMDDWRQPTLSRAMIERVSKDD